MLNVNYKVYVHTNKHNGKMYVGITKNNPNQRWLNGRGYKKSFAFNNAIIKYGWEGFYHEVVASGLNREEAENFEIILIRELNTTNDNYGYNISKGGNTGHGYKGKFLGKRYDWTGKKSPHVSIMNLKKSKPIKQYDLNGKFIKEYSSIKGMARETGYNGRTISDVCHNKRVYSYESIWIFKGNEKELKERLKKVSDVKQIRKPYKNKKGYQNDTIQGC